MSGLQGKALLPKQWPTKAEVFAAIPPHLLKRDTGKSMMYAVISTVLTLACGAIGTQIPADPAFAPLWLLYATVTGAPIFLTALLRSLDIVPLALLISVPSTDP